MNVHNSLSQHSIYQTPRKETIVLFLITTLIVLVTGVAVLFGASHFSLRGYHGALRITWYEFGIVAILLTGFSFLVTVVVGPDAAKAQAAAGYKQFFNGSVINARIEQTTCSRDGSCSHHYQCDHYTTTEFHPAETDSKGNVTRAAYTETIDHYHDCPYVTVELSYYLDDNIGRTITVASHIFEANPQEWRGGHGIPDGVPRGVPERWQQSKNRLDAGDAEPVTDVREYTNYILPSEDKVLKYYSSSIDTYQKANLLPAHTQDLNNVLYDLNTKARKIQFVGITPSNADLWQERLMAFNASLGSERQGDLHIVVVSASQVTNPEDYVGALVAYWQSKLGNWGFPKNGVALVLGVSDDSKTIVWSRAKTGMPEGNGGMLTAMQFELEGKAFDPDVVLGRITAQAYVREDGKLKARYTHGTGIVDTIMFQSFPFLRACMGCKDKTDNGTGYVYLKDSIPVSTGAQVLMFVIVFFVALVLWGSALYFDPLGSILGTRVNPEPEKEEDDEDPFLDGTTRIRNPYRTRRY